MNWLKMVKKKILLLFQQVIHFFPFKINKKLFLPIQAILLLGFIGSIIFYLWPRTQEISGYLEGEYVRVAVPFSGLLTELKVIEGDRTQEKQLLFKLDDREEKSQYDQSAGQLNEAQAQLKNILKGKRPEEIDVIKADLESARAQVELTKLIYERQRKLVETKVTSIENLDKAETEYIRAKALAKQLEAQLAVAKLPARPDEIVAAQAKVEAARADVSRSQWRLDQKSGIALQEGIVTNRFFQLGEFVPSNTPVIEILPDHAIRAVFFVSSDIMATLTYGQTIFIHTGAETVICKVTYISPSAEYTPPVIYSNESKKMLVFRIEARPLKPNPRLHPGQPITVTLA